MIINNIYDSRSNMFLLQSRNPALDDEDAADCFLAQGTILQKKKVS